MARLPDPRGRGRFAEEQIERAAEGLSRRGRRRPGVGEFPGRTLQQQRSRNVRELTNDVSQPLDTQRVLTGRPGGQRLRPLPSRDDVSPVVTGDPATAVPEAFTGKEPVPRGEDPGRARAIIRGDVGGALARNNRLRLAAAASAQQAAERDPNEERLAEIRKQRLNRRAELTQDANLEPTFANLRKIRAARAGLAALDQEEAETERNIIENQGADAPSISDRIALEKLRRGGEKDVFERGLALSQEAREQERFARETGRQVKDLELRERQANLQEAGFNAAQAEQATKSLFPRFEDDPERTNYNIEQESIFQNRLISSGLSPQTIGTGPALAHTANTSKLQDSLSQLAADESGFLFGLFGEDAAGANSIQDFFTNLGGTRVTFFGNNKVRFATADGSSEEVDFGDIPEGGGQFSFFKKIIEGKDPSVESYIRSVLSPEEYKSFKRRVRGEKDGLTR